MTNKYKVFTLPQGTKLSKLDNPRPGFKHQQPSFQNDKSNNLNGYWSPPERMCLDLQCSSTVPEIKCDLSDLLLDLSHYQIISGKDSGHTGGLLDHSIWTYRFLIHYMSQLPIFQPHFISCIPNSYYPVLQVSGLLHDIGKAGDLETLYFQKPDHPEQGWKYILDQADYIWVNHPNQPKLRSYLESKCQLTSQEWNLVGIVSALHYDIGNLCAKKITVEKLIQRLLDRINQTNTPFDPKIIFRIIRAITLADVWAQKQVETEQPGLVQIPNLEITSRKRSQIDNWKKYRYDVIYPHLEKVEVYLDAYLNCTPIYDDIFLGPIYFCRIDLLPTLTSNPSYPKLAHLDNPTSNISQMIINSEVRLLDLSNLKNLELLAEEPPYNDRSSISSDECFLVCHASLFSTRLTILKFIRTILEYRHHSSLHPARNIILKWWNQHSKNKLNPNQIETLVKQLSHYPRSGWTEDKIRMKLFGLINPKYTIDHFISEYDVDVMSDLIQNNQKVFTELIVLINSLGPRFPIESLSRYNSWESLLEYLSKDDAFAIPILSPRGMIQVLYYITRLISENCLVKSLIFGNDQGNIMYETWGSGEISKLISYFWVNYHKNPETSHSFKGFKGFIVPSCDSDDEKKQVVTLFWPDKIGL